MVAAKQDKKLIASILVLCGFVTVLSVALFLSVVPLFQCDSPFRVITGAITIFLLPGLLWGEIIGFRARHTLEVIALSVAVSLMIAFIFLPIPLMIGARIEFWIFCVLAVVVVGLYFNVRKLLHGQPFYLITGIMGQRNSSQPAYLLLSQVASLMVIALLTYGAYQWGEDMFDIGREKLFQSLYLRYYFDMPLNINMIAPIRGIPMLNIIYFWEFLLAAWARLVGMDPLPLYCRARCVVPLLGLSGVYLLIRHLFFDKFKREYVFWIVLIMAAGFFMLYSPSSFDFIKNDPTRGAFCFMGVNHHAETAVEILLPLGGALLLMCIKQPNVKNYLLLAVFLAVSLIWHAREFFQLGIFFAILFVVLLVYPFSNRKRSLKGVVVVMFAFVLVVFSYLILAAVLMLHKTNPYDEFLIKKTALIYAFSSENILSVRNFFNFPTIYLMYGWGNLGEAIGVNGLKILSGSNYFAPLIMGALVVPLIVKWGIQEDKRLTIWFLLTWFFCLCWNFSMHIIMFFSYAEIFVLPVRYVYLFAYLVLGNGLFVGIKWVYERFSWNKAYFIIFAICFVFFGYYLNLWIQTVMVQRHMSDARALSVILWMSLAYLLVGKSFWGRRNNIECCSILERKKGSSFIAMLGMSCMLLFPVMGNDLVATFYRAVTQARPDMGWFSGQNIFGLSEDLLRFIRGLPPQQLFMVNPLGKGALALYAPQYLDVLPSEISWVTVQKVMVDDARNDKHILFNSRVAKAREDDDVLEKVYNDLRKYIRERKIDYIFVEKKYYVVLRRFFTTYNAAFEVVFDNPAYGELVVRVRHGN